MVLSGTTSVGLTSGVTYATFNIPMNSGTVLSTSGIFMTVSGQANFLTTGHISGIYAMDPTGTIVAFIPASGVLKESTWYTAYASASGIQAANGIQLSGSLYSGTSWQTILPAVVSGLVPASGATVSGGQLVTFVFSDTMDPTTITTSGIFIVNSGQSNPATTGHISGVFEPLSAGSQTSIIQFTPNSGQFVAGNWYNAIVSSGCLDVWEVGISGGLNVTGNAFAINGPPILSGIIPASGTTNVAQNATLLYTFSNPMASSTINTSGIYVVISGQATPQTTGHLTGVVSLQASPNNNTAQFIPNSGQLSGNQWYILMVTSGVTDTFNTLLSGGAFFSGGSIKINPAAPGVVTPQISGTSPISGTSAVASNVVPTITVNTQVSSASTNTNTVKLVDIGVSGLTAPSNVAITTSISSDLTLITATPSALLANAHYFKIEVSGLLAAADNVTIQSPEFSGAVFIVEPVLSIVSQTPVSGTGSWSGKVTLGTLPQLVFNGSGRTTIPQSAEVTASSVNMLYVHGSVTRTNITTSLKSDNQTIVITPTNNLSGGLFEYRINTSGIQDTAGVFMTPYSGFNDFSTIQDCLISSTNPASGATSVVVTTDVTLTMISGTSTSATVNATSVKLVISGASISASISLSSDNLTITIDPTSNLLNSSTYFICVSGISDTNGLVGFSGNGWSGTSFTTAAPPLTQFANVPSAGSLHNLGMDNTSSDFYNRIGERAGTSSSDMVGRKVLQASCFLSSNGNPTGTVFMRIYSGATSTSPNGVGGTLQATLGSLAASSISSTSTEYIFGPISNNFACAQDTIVVTEYSGATSSDYLIQYKNGSDPYDGSNSYLTRYTYTHGYDNETGSTDSCGRMWD